MPVTARFTCTPLERWAAIRTCAAPKGVQHQTTAGRECVWGAGSSGCYRRDPRRLHAGKQSNQRHRLRHGRYARTSLVEGLNAIIPPSKNRRDQRAVRRSPRQAARPDRECLSDGETMVRCRDALCQELQILPHRRPDLLVLWLNIS